MTHARYDALVLGGGPAGATAAILLAAAGWSVALVEKARFPRRKVCGECIAATNFPLLDALGVGAAVAARAGPPLRRMGLCAGEHLLTGELPPLRRGAEPWGRALGREHLDTLLLRRATSLGATVYQRWTVKQVDRRNGRHECLIAACDSDGTQTLAAPVVIDARGSWEPGSGVRPPAHARDLLGFKANFSGARLDPGLLPVLAFDGGYGGMVLADGGMLTLACCVRRDRLRLWRAAAPGAAAGLAVEQALARSCLGVRRALDGARREGAWLGVGPIRPGARPAWHERTGFAVGNAAGEAHPILGEGISMAIQSAFLLCARLERRRAELLDGRAQASVARGYAADWRRNFAARLRWSALLASLAMRPRAAAPLLPLLRRWPGLLTFAAVAGGKVRPLALREPGAGAAARPLPSAARANVAAPPPVRETR